METLNIEIQLCRLVHLNSLVCIAVAAYNDNYRHIWEDNGAGYVAQNFSKMVLQNELIDANNEFYILKSSTETVGFAKIVLNKSYENFSDSDTLYLHRLYLLKSSVGKGIGSFFMEFLKKRALQYNKELIWLQAMPNTPSVNFYLRHGYEIEKKGFILFPRIKKEFSDLFDMVLRLP